MNVSVQNCWHLMQLLIFQRICLHLIDMRFTLWERLSMFGWTALRIHMLDSIVQWLWEMQWNDLFLYQFASRILRIIIQEVVKSRRVEKGQDFLVSNTKDFLWVQKLLFGWKLMPNGELWNQQTFWITILRILSQRNVGAIQRILIPNGTQGIFIQPSKQG